MSLLETWAVRDQCSRSRLMFGDCFDRMACANIGRRFIGIERDEGYFAVAERRIREAEGAARERASVIG